MSIKNGDLVMIIKPTTCCNSTVNIGKIFIAEDVKNSGNDNFCLGCKKVSPPCIKTKFPWGGLCPISRLKKIDPLPESTKYDQEIEVRV